MTPRQLRVLRCVFEALVEVYEVTPSGKADWPRIVRLALQYGRRIEPPIAEREVYELGAMRLDELN